MRNLQRSSAEKSEVGLSSHGDEVIISKHDQKKLESLKREKRRRERGRERGKNEGEQIKTYNPTDFTALSAQSRVLALLVEFVDGLGASGDC